MRKAIQKVPVNNSFLFKVLPDTFHLFNGINNSRK